MTKKMIILILNLFIMLTLILTGCKSTSENNQKAMPIWPNEHFPTATPESQGMDSGELTDMFAYIQSRGLDLHHIMVIRNGYNIVESHYYPYEKEDLHILNSITKSVTSSLIGKAIDENLIKSVETPVQNLFPERSFKNDSDRWTRMQLKHLLTMTAGFEWTEDGNYGASYDSYTQMSQSEDRIQFMLDLPVVDEPGSAFYYNTGASHLMSGIITEVTDQPALDYAIEKIFTPIGIKNVFWNADQQGLSSGGSGLFLTTEDLARYGYLFLNLGKWDQLQVLPESWIKAATEKKIDTPNGLAGRDGYGYQWWMNAFGGFSARGYAGQYLFVLPEENLIVITLGSMKGPAFFEPESLVANYILPSIQSNASISANPDGLAKLSKIMVENAAIPTAQPLQDLPQAASLMSGKHYDLENNENIQIDFTKGQNTARLRWFTDEVQYDVPVGLDQVYRFSPCPDFYVRGMTSQVGFRGEWISENTFNIHIRPREADSSYTLTLTFEDGNLIKSFKID